MEYTELPAVQVHRILIYQDGGTWVFDDNERGFEGEPFLFGMENLLDEFVGRIPEAARGFYLHIANDKFPKSQDFLVRTEEDAGGFWYYSPTYKCKGWMGNNGLTRYFPDAPEHIHVRAESLPENHV